MKNIVFLWVWWTWLSAIAWMLNELWFDNIIWIDSQESEITKKLFDKWIKIIIWHWKYKPNYDDFIIYSDIESIKNWPEIQHFMQFQNTYWKRRIPLSYNQFLWEISKRFRTISIAWSKWKSTSTAMSIYLMNKVSNNFWIGIVGALLPDFDNKNFVINHKHKNEIYNIFKYFLSGKWILNYNYIKKFWFIIEACEYKEHFLLLDTEYWLITNFYYDHSDWFQTYKKYLSAYLKFIKNAGSGIFLSEKYKNWIWEQESRISIDWSIKKKIFFLKEKIINYNFVFWEHLQYNWSLVIGILEKILNKKINSNLLSNFHWVRRRMELIWKNKYKKEIFSDYAHTAQSIQTWLKALKNKFNWQKILVIFQPHQATRILQQRNNFNKIFQLEKTNNINLIIYKLYTAREQISNFDFSQFDFLKNKKIENFDNLWTIFAKKNHWQYITNINKIYELIENYKNWPIVLFTAWDLDFQIRNFFKKR